MFTFLNPVLLVQGFGKMGKHEDCLMFTFNYKMYVLQVYLEITSSQQVFQLKPKIHKKYMQKKNLYTKQKENHNRTTNFDLYYITSHFACFCQISCLFPTILLFIHQPYFNKTKCMHLPYIKCSFHFFSKPPYE